MSVNQRKIIVGLSGGIACYKAAELVRLLRQNGALVQVVMTTAAQQFMTPLTLQALSGRAVRDSLFGLEAENAMNHIELARWADMILIAPASAHCIARLAQGMADDLLTTLCLASQSPLVIVPAMNRFMWQNQLTQRNIQTLKENGVMVWGPGVGEQACGDVGLGRMLEPVEIIEQLHHFFLPLELSRKKVLITAGPTQEPLDPVRYLSNYSSGKMGYALAEAAKNLGATVTLISGPTELTPVSNVHFISVKTALEMQQAVFSNLDAVDIFIAAAAVADFRAKKYQKNKMKKSGQSMQIELIQNPDILFEVAHADYRPRCVVGFAAESEQLQKNAFLKLQKKNLDYIIANNIVENPIFGQDESEVIMLARDGSLVLSAKGSKRQIAVDVLRMISGRTIVDMG